MAKTIRSHPTSHFILPEPISGTTLIFSGFGPKMDLRFLHFPTSLHVKRQAPKGKKMRMDHPFILGFCQNLIFDMVSSIIWSLFRQKPFLKLVSYFNSFVYLRFKYGIPPNSYLKIEFSFQNRTLTTNPPLIYHSLPLIVN